MNKLRKFKDFRFYAESSELWHKDQLIELPSKAAELLERLISNPGEIVKKDVLISDLWPESDSGGNNLAQTIHLLRKVFERHGERDLISTVPRRGYRFVAEVVKDDHAGEKLTSQQTEISLPEQTEVTSVVNIPKAERIIFKQPRFLYAAIVAAVLLVFLFGGIYVSTISDTTASRNRVMTTSLAILPFNPVDATDNDLGVRIADSVITRINRLENINVRPTSAVASIKYGEGDVQNIGSRLKVDIIVQGSFRTVGGTLQIDSKAILVKTGETLWNDQFSGSREKLLTLQDSITERLAVHLSKMHDAEVIRGLKDQPTNDPEAFESYVKGREAWRKRNYESIKNAVKLFEKAVELDPDFAAAHVGLADSLFLLYDRAYEIDLSVVDKAKAHIDKAIDLDPSFSEAHSTLGLIRRIYDREIDLAESSFKTALELDPNSPEALNRYGLLLARHQRFDEAEATLRRALEFDPTSANITKNIGQVLYFKRDYDGAVQQFRNSLDLDPLFVTSKWLLARSLWLKGEKDLAMRAYADALRSVGTPDIAEMIEADLPTADYDLILSKWIKIWQGLEIYGTVVLTAHRNDREETFRLLKKAVEERHPWADKIHIEPDFAFLSDDPQFQQLLADHF